MLPSPFLRVRVSKGKIHPIYSPLDQQSLGLAEQMIGAYQGNMGKKKALLIQRIKSFEDEGFDYRFVRGLAALLERRCVFEAESSIDPKYARSLVFQEASRRKSVGRYERRKIIEDVSLKLNLSTEALEKILWSDMEEELILNRFKSIGPSTLIKYYNLSLTQTLLFKCVRMEFSASNNWKAIFRTIKWRGLMYSIEQIGTDYSVSVDGPLSLFKMTDRYGTSLAKLLPQILRAESWRIRADIIGRRKNRIYIFEVKSDDAKGKMEDIEHEEYPQFYDSTVEEKFAKGFNSYNSGWELKREPEPLIAGRHVLIPDFSFEKYGAKVYLEIVGFWTQEYLERKITKLNAIPKVDILVAVDESLACSKLQKLRSKVFYYSKDVPLRPIIDHLKKREEMIVDEQIEILQRQTIQLQGDVVSIEDLASAYKVSPESLKRAFQGFIFDGYTRIGEYYVNEKRIKELREKIERSSEAKLSEIFSIIEAKGLNNPLQFLESIGYTIAWEGLDCEKSRIKKVTPEGNHT